MSSVPVQPLRILIVDDEEDVEFLFRRRFRREEREGVLALAFAQSGEAALSYLQDHDRPDVALVLSDINMPGMSGLDLLQRLKTEYPALPVVMITAYDDPARRALAETFGADDYITKPLDFEALRQRLVDHEAEW